MKNILSRKSLLGYLFILSLILIPFCHKSDDIISNINKDTINIDQSKKHKRPVTTIINPFRNLYTFNWDKVGIFPTNMSWNSYGDCDYDNPSIPNTLGNGNFASIVTGFSGWEFNTGYNNDSTRIDNLIKYNGHSSIHFILNPFEPALPGCIDAGANNAAGASNVRAEITFMGGNYGYQLPIGCELWMSWCIYIPNINHFWDSTTGGGDEALFHQIFSGPSSNSPSIQLMTFGTTTYCNLLATIGTLGITGDGGENFYNTGYIILQGHWLRLIEHIIFDQGTNYGGMGNGLYQLWVKDISTGIETEVINSTNQSGGITTLYHGAGTISYMPGNIKFGIYHCGWHSSSPTNAQASVNNGTTRIEYCLGPLMIEINPTGNYNSNGKTDVSQ